MSDEDKKKQYLNRILPEDAEEDGTADGGLLFGAVDHPPEDDTDEGEGGTGGQSGKIDFHFQDPLSAPKREDLLSPNEIKRLLAVHQEVHKGRVNNQKITREQRAAVKEGRYTTTQRQGLGGGGSHSPYKKHRISDKAQFSGVDKQVVGVPTLNESQTNAQMQDELENRLTNKLQNRLQNQYKNTPKLRPY